MGFWLAAPRCRAAATVGTIFGSSYPCGREPDRTPPEGETASPNVKGQRRCNAAVTVYAVDVGMVVAVVALCSPRYPLAWWATWGRGRRLGRIDTSARRLRSCQANPYPSVLTPPFFGRTWAISSLPTPREVADGFAAPNLGVTRGVPDLPQSCADAKFPAAGRAGRRTIASCDVCSSSASCVGAAHASNRKQVRLLWDVARSGRAPPSVRRPALLCRRLCTRRRSIGCLSPRRDRGTRGPRTPRLAQEDAELRRRTPTTLSKSTAPST